MIVFVMVCTLLLLALTEILSRREELRHLHVEFSLDSRLAEPDEPITLRYTVLNTSPFPVLCAGLSLQLDPELSLCEEESWQARHAHRDFLGTRIDHRFYLLPHRRFSGKLRLSCRRRGLYEIGSYYLERSDFMGLSPVISSGETGLRLVCTARRRELPELDTRGGTLGEDGKLHCVRAGVPYELQDDAEVLRFFAETSGQSPREQAAAFLSNEAFFGQDLTRIPGLEDSVADSLAAILERGMKAVVDERFA